MLQRGQGKGFGKAKLEVEELICLPTVTEEILKAWFPLKLPLG